MAITGNFNFGGLQISGSYLTLGNIHSELFRNYDPELGWSKMLRVTYTYDIFSSQEHYQQNANDALKEGVKNRFFINPIPTGSLDFYDLCYSHLKETYTEFTDI